LDRFDVNCVHGGNWCVAVCQPPTSHSLYIQITKNERSMQF